MTSAAILKNLKWVRLFLIVVSYIGFIFLGMPDSMRGVAGPSIRAEFQLPLDALGTWLIATTIGYLVSSFNGGKILARFGAGRALSVAFALMGAGVIGYGLAPAYPFLILLGLGVGLGAGTIDAGLNTFVAANYNHSLMYWLHAMFGIGATLGPWVMNTVLQSQQSWRVGYLLVGAVGILIALVIMLTTQHWNSLSAQTNPEAEAVPHMPLRETLKLPEVWLSITLYFIYAGIEFIPNEWAYSVMTTVRGIDPKTAGDWMVIYWLSFTIGRLLSGFITLRLNERTYLRLSMVGMVVGALLFAINPQRELGLISLAIIGFSIAPLFPALINSTAQRVGTAHAANTIGFQIAATGTGIGILTSLSGVIAARVSLEIIGVIMATVAIIVFLLHELIIARMRGREQRATTSI